VFNDENLSEAENRIHFVGFTGDCVCNSVIASVLVEDKEREDRSSVASTEILTLTEVLEEEVFAEYAKVIFRDSICKLDIAILEDLSARVDTTAELLISCGTEVVVPSSIGIVAVSLVLGSIIKDIRKEVFAL